MKILVQSTMVIFLAPSIIVCIAFMLYKIFTGQMGNEMTEDTKERIESFVITFVISIPSFALCLLSWGALIIYFTK